MPPSDRHTANGRGTPPSNPSSHEQPTATVYRNVHHATTNGSSQLAEIGGSHRPGLAHVVHTHFFPTSIKPNKAPHPPPTCYVACRSRGWQEARLFWRPCRSRSVPPRTPAPLRAETDCLSWLPTAGHECPEPGRSVLRVHTQTPFAESVWGGGGGVGEGRQRERGDEAGGWSSV